jgi:hypothetical protein
MIENAKVLSRADLNRLPVVETEETKNAKRVIREKLLTAWDIHKSNVSYGAETETEEEHAKCITWWKAICNLEDWAFEEIPEGVKKHLKE